MSPGKNQRVCPNDIKNCPNMIPIKIKIISPANKFPYSLKAKATCLEKYPTNSIGLMNESNIDSEMGFGFPYISVSRHIKGGFSIGAQYNIGESKINNLKKDYVSIDGFLKYCLSNKKFIPFIIGGYGLSNFENDPEADGYFPSRSAGRTIFGGIGFDIFFTEKISLNLSSTYRSSNENGSFNHIQSLAALNFNFGGRDSDKDLSLIHI